MHKLIKSIKALHHFVDTNAVIGAMIGQYRRLLDPSPAPARASSTQPMMRAGTPAARAACGVPARAPRCRRRSWRRRRSLDSCPAPWRRKRSRSTPRRTWDGGRRVPCRCRPESRRAASATPSSTTAVSPITTPVPWSMKMPLPMRARGGWMSSPNRALAQLCRKVRRGVWRPAATLMGDARGLQRVIALEPRAADRDGGAGRITIGDGHDVETRRQPDGRMSARQAPRRRSGGSARRGPRWCAASRAR